MIKKLYIFSILLIIPFITFSQKLAPIYLGNPKVFHYSKDDYNASTQSWAITQDQNNIIYIANTFGLIVYDGAFWYKLELPNTQIARGVVDYKGQIFVVGDNNFGYLTADSVGNITFKSLNDLIPDTIILGDIWQIIADSQYVYFLNSDYLFVYSPEENRLKAIVPLPEDIFNTLLIIGDSLYMHSRTRLYVFDLNKKAILVSNKLKNFKINLENQRIRVISPAFDDKVIFIRADTIFLLDQNFKVLKKVAFNLPEGAIWAYASNDIYFVVNIGLVGYFFINSDLEVVYFLSKDNGLTDNTALNLYFDSYNNLWIATDNGIDYVILNSPFSYLDKRNNLGDKIMYTYKVDTLLFFNAPQELRYLSVNQLFIPTSKKVANSLDLIGQFWRGIVLNDSVIYLGYYNTIVKINNKLQYSTVFETNDVVWDIQRIPKTNKVLIGTGNGPIIADIINGSLTNFRQIENIKGNFRYYTFDSTGTLWFQNYLDTGIFARALVDTSNSLIKILKYYTKKDGIESPYTASPFYYEAQDWLLVNDNATVKIWDKKTDKFKPFKPITKHFSKATEIYLMGFDNFDNIWVNVVDYNQIPGLKYKVFLFKPTPKGLLINKYLTNSIVYRDYALTVLTLKNRYVILNTTKGIVIFDYHKPLDITKLRFNVYLRRIETIENDSVIWNGFSINKDNKLQLKPNYIEIPFKHNGIRFYVAANFYENPKLTLYSYKLEGLDSKWSPWTTDTKKEYSYLKEGEYTLKVKAKNIYSIESPVYSYTFRVLPPWWRTNTAYAVYVVLFLLGLYGSMRIYAYNLRKKAEKLEQLVRERTKEIEMKNAELEQQKEEILTQAEELAKINKELEKLSTIVQKTDNAVILTDEKGDFVWVNPAFTKIFGYTLEELKAEVSPNIIGKNTPPEIKEKIQKCFREKVTVEYETKYKTKDGREIWVHTTLTPILDENGDIYALIAIDSDITKLKEAEEKIRIQNENIKGSIRYAQVIQKSILPTKEEIDKYFESFILYKPRDIVSGDFYWISKLFVNLESKETYNCVSQNPNFKVKNYLLFAVVDCTGHGVPGAFMSLIGNRLLDDIVNHSNVHSPKKVLELMDKRLAQIFKHTDENYRDGMVVSLVRFDKICYDEQPIIKVTYAGAKLPVLHYNSASGELIEYRGVRRTIGVESVVKQDFKETVFYIHKDDIIFLYTDGYKDQNNKLRKKIGITRFKSLLMENINKPMDQIKKELEDFLQKWMEGTDQRDDITVIGLKVSKI